MSNGEHWEDMGTSPDPSLLTASMTNAMAEASAWATPLFVTEFGCDQSWSTGADWIRYELDLQDQMLASSTAWAWEPGSWGIRYEDASGNIVYWPDTLAVVSRPYPRAVAGDLESVERPFADQMIVHYRTNPSVTSAVHEVSASPDYFSSYSILCDGAPAANVVQLTGRATFTCTSTAPGEHTFEIDGVLSAGP
jgi:hypothetical protein